MFDTTLDESGVTNYDKLVSVTDTNFSLTHRVRSYLDANCAQCHRPGGVPAFWDARFDTPLPNQNIINGAVANTLGIYRLVPAATLFFTFYVLFFALTPARYQVLQPGGAFRPQAWRRLPVARATALSDRRLRAGELAIEHQRPIDRQPRR